MIGRLLHRESSAIIMIFVPPENGCVSSVKPVSSIGWQKRGEHLDLSKSSPPNSPLRRRIYGNGIKHTSRGYLNE